MIHTDVKPFSCNYCFKKIRHKTALIEHERIHTGEKPFCCQLCTKTFRQKAVLIYHERAGKCQIEPSKKKKYVLPKSASKNTMKRKKEIKAESMNRKKKNQNRNSVTYPY